MMEISLVGALVGIFCCLIATLNLLLEQRSRYKHLSSKIDELNNKHKDAGELLLEMITIVRNVRTHSHLASQCFDKINEEIHEAGSRNRNYYNSLERDSEEMFKKLSKKLWDIKHELSEIKPKKKSKKVDPTKLKRKYTKKDKDFWGGKLPKDLPEDPGELSSFEPKIFYPEDK